VATQVTTLSALTPPSNLTSLQSSRVSPTETQAVILTNVDVTDIRIETDSDYHLVLNDGHGHTMVAEVPCPSCVGSASAFSCFITQVRGAVDTIGTTTSTNVATIIGVPFFDYAHGQTGDAPNSIEIHPVLSICFGLDCSVPTAYLQLHNRDPDAYRWLLPPPTGSIPTEWLTGEAGEEELEQDEGAAAGDGR
jgi:hypothetical protein